MRDYTRRLSVWSMLCGVPTLAVIGILALSAVSCRSQRYIEKTEMKEDSLREVSTESVTVETVLQAVPGDSVGVTVPMTVMQNLPDGAAFTSKQGRTRVSLKREGDNVVAVAESDSVGRETQRYERRARDALRQGGSESRTDNTEKKAGGNGWALGVVGFVGIVGGVGIVGAGIFILIRKRIKQH